MSQSSPPPPFFNVQTTNQKAKKHKQTNQRIKTKERTKEIKTKNQNQRNQNKRVKTKKIKKQTNYLSGLNVITRSSPASA